MFFLLYLSHFYEGLPYLCCLFILFHNTCLSYFPRLHLFLLSLCNNLYSVPYLCIVYCCLFAMLRIIFVIHSFFLHQFDVIKSFLYMSIYYSLVDDLVRFTFSRLNLLSRITGRMLRPQSTLGYVSQYKTAFLNILLIVMYLIWFFDSSPVLLHVHKRLEFNMLRDLQCQNGQLENV